MKKTDFTEANRQAWNAALPYHRKARDEYWDACFSQENWVFQTEPELSKLHEIGFVGRDIVQLCCNNGIELLSLKRTGAGRCLGFDICDEAIKDARRRAEQFGIEAEFRQSDVYAIEPTYHNCFDLVYITIGALTWLPDLEGFFQIAHQLLRPQGKIFIYEQHPFTNVLPWDATGQQQKPELVESYFQESFWEDCSSLDYYGCEEYASPVKYEFLHTLSDIFGAFLKAGFTMREFREYEHDISNGMTWIQKTGLKLPLSYILIGARA